MEKIKQHGVTLTGKTIDICRSDFNDHRDSEGIEYFDYILSSLNIPEGKKKLVSCISLLVTDFEIEY